MKKAAITLLQVVKWIVALIILLLSLTTLLGGSYIQTILLVLSAVILIWWPSGLMRRWNRSINLVIRGGMVILLFISGLVVFGTGPESGIYITEELKDELMRLYDERVQVWPDGTKDLYLTTAYGTVHVLVCGSEDLPPLVMVHAASMGAHSWAENLGPLLGHYRIYSVDNIGEGNKSNLDDVRRFPRNQEEVADHFAEIMDQLGIDRSPVFGASNGGYIAQSYAFHYPERVQSLALFGPMGLTKLTGKSIMMLSVSTMYPMQRVRDGVTRWALGENEKVLETYGEWFNCIMKATIPSVAMPVPMTSEQKSQMRMPVLLFLGTNDPIVGDAEIARNTAMDYPDIKIEVLESGHLVAVERADRVNVLVSDFLGI